MSVFSFNNVPAQSPDRQSARPPATTVKWSCRPLTVQRIEKTRPRIGCSCFSNGSDTLGYGSFTHEYK